MQTVNDYVLDSLRSSTATGELPALAFPGGYPLLYLTVSDAVICPDCANKRDEYDPVATGDIHFEGPALECDECGYSIESAHGDPWADESEGEG